jgi:dihydroxyacetone kinase-like protein
MTGIQLNNADLASALIKVAGDMKRHISQLRDLDAAMGDGDLGVTVGMGSDAMIAYLSAPDETDIGKMLVKCGMNVNKVNPSTFGTLQASAFIGAGKAVLNKTEVAVADLISMGNGAIDGIKKRGKAEVGDKTMLDSLVPAVETFQRSYNEKEDILEALKAAVSAAETGMLATDNMKAKFGRGSWRPDGTVGKRDGGATAFYFMIESFARHLRVWLTNRSDRSDLVVLLEVSRQANWAKTGEGNRQ